ncbi:hypothetical protein LCGC14_2962060, partial [marine sediment metagenome]
MNFCTKCKSFYEKAGTCNCFAWDGTVSYMQVACSGCGKIPCDHSGTACPPLVTTTITCT